MKCDVILAGVGGQGVLSLSAVIASGALKQGLHVKQSEVHGMAQRRGAVVAHLRLADHPVASALIPRGTADLIVSVEPLEGLRYLEYLAPHGALLTSIEPMVNIPDYPELPTLLAALRTSSRVHLVDTSELARRAGSARAANMVMVGAAVHWLPVSPATLETHIREAFARKGDAVVDANLRAFRLGMEVMECARP